MLSGGVGVTTVGWEYNCRGEGGGEGGDTGVTEAAAAGGCCGVPL